MKKEKFTLIEPGVIGSDPKYKQTTFKLGKKVGTKIEGVPIPKDPRKP